MSSKKQKKQSLVSLQQQLELQNAELLHCQYIIQQQQQFQVQQFYQQQQQQYLMQQKNTTIVIQSPNISTVYDPHYPNIFLGGFIGSDDWQKVIIDKLKGHTVYIYNPRRDNWKKNPDTTDSSEDSTVHNQFSWEMEHFEKSNCIVFWFPWDNSNNIGSYLQLGRCSTMGKNVFVGIHSRNKDKKTIYEFVRMTIPHAYITSKMTNLVKHISNWVVTGRMPESTNSSCESLSL